MDTLLLSAKRRQEYEEFRRALTERLRADLVVLAAVIRERTDEHTLESDDPVVSEYLDCFVTKFASRLDVEFDRLSAGLSASEDEYVAVCNPPRRASPDRPAGDAHTAGHAVSKDQSFQTPAAHDRPVTMSEKRESPANPESGPVTPPQTPPTAGKPEYSLTTGDIGPALIPTLSKWVADGGFTGKVKILDIRPVDWSNLRGRVRRPKHHDLLGVEYAVGKADEHFSLLGLSRSTKFRFPNLSKAVARPSETSIQEYLQKLSTRPPKGTIPYYVGPSLTPDFDCYLDSGPNLSRLSAIPGVNTLYWHAGNKGSGTAFHCEDANFRSCNITMFGWKLWIIIGEGHTGKFEAFIRRHWGGSYCDQFVRHHSLYISPARLEAEGIDFEVYCAGPGDMVITAPRQYHAVVNITPCLAISTNFLLPDESIISGPLTVCPECGLHALDSGVLESILCISEDDVTDPALKHIRPSVKDESAATGSSSTVLTESRKRRIEFEVLTPSKRQREDASLEVMADRLIDGCSMRRFVNHVAASKVSGPTLEAIGHDVAGNWDEQVARLYTLGTSLSHPTEFHQLQSVMVAAQAVDIIDNTVSAFGFTRVPHGMIEQVLQKLGQDITSSNRKKLQDWLKMPRKLLKVLGPFRGLMMFLPFEKEDPNRINEYLQLAESDINKLQSILKDEVSTTALDHMGRLLEESMQGGRVLPQRIWQGLDAEQLEKLGGKRLEQLMEADGEAHISHDGG